MDLSVVGPEDRDFVVVVVVVVAVVDGAVVAGAEGDAVAACRFGAIAEKGSFDDGGLGITGRDIQII